MSLSSWLRTLGRRIAGTHPRRARPQAPSRWRRCAILVELLEDRTLLSTYNWKPGNLTGNWNDANNWTSPDGGTTFPVAGDTAIFGGAPTAAVNVSLNGAQSAATVTFSNTAQSYIIAPSGTSPSLTIGTSLTSSATAGLNNVISAAVTANNAAMSVTNGNLTLGGQVTASSVTGTVSGGLLRLSNFGAGASNSVTGTFTVSGGTLEAFSTQTANTDSIGTANVVLSGGTLKLDPIPSVFATTSANTVGVVGRYYNFGFTPTNSTTGTNQADYSGPPAATRNEGTINFPAANPSTFQPAGVNATNFGVDWVGGLNILTGGSYTFTWVTDDSGTLLIDGAVVVNNLLNATGTGTVTLTPGFHSVDARMVQIGGGGGAVLSYTGPDPGTTATVIPVAADATKGGLFQYSTTAATFTNNVTVSAGATGTVDVSNAAMDPTLGTLTTGTGSTLNVTGSFTGRTVIFGNVTLQGNTTFNPTGGNITPAVISDGGSNATLTKSGAGTLTLNQANTYAGGTVLKGGTLALGNASALSSGGLTVNSGAVVLNVAGALGSTISLTAGENLVVNQDNLLNGVTVTVGAGATLQATTVNGLAGAAINLNGGGLSLRADAPTTFNAGALTINSNASTLNVNRLVTNAGAQTLTLAPTSLAFGSGVNTLNITGGNGDTLQLNSALALPGTFTVNTIDANLSLNGAVSGAAKIIKTGVNTLNFLVDSTAWTGSSGATLDVVQGTAALFTANAGGATTSTVTLKGGTLGLRNNTNNTLFNVNVVIDPAVPQGTVDVNNAGSGSGNTLIIASLSVGAGQTFNLTGANTYKLQVNATVSLGAGAATVFNTSSADLLLGSTGVTTVASVVGPGTLAKTGGNRMTLFQANTGTGSAGIVPAIINAGVLEVRSIFGLAANGAGNAPVTLNGGTLDLRRDSAATYSLDVIVTANNATLNVQSAGGSTTGLTLGISSLKVSNNTLTKTSANTYTLQVVGTTTLTGSPTLAVNNDALLLNAVSDGGGGFGITKTGAGTLQLNAAASYTGDTRANAGTVQVTSTGTIAGNAFVEPGAILRLEAAANIAAGKSVVVTSSPTAVGELDARYNGALPSVTAASTGVLALGAGTYSQALNLATLGDGTFFLGASVNTTLTGTLTPSGTTYRLGGGGGQLAVGGTNVLADNVGATRLVAGTALANGTGNLTNGTGTVVLLNNNTYTGGTVVNRGSTLVVATTANASGSPLGAGAVTVWGTLTAAGASGSFLANGSTTANTNAVTLNPGSTLTFDNTNAFRGVTAGNNPNRWGDSAGITLNGATLRCSARTTPRAPRRPSAPSASTRAAPSSSSGTRPATPS
jgi:autotransporter-associated beta strand protein